MLKQTKLCTRLIRRFTPIVASEGFTLPTGSTRKRKCRMSSSSTCRSRSRRRSMIKRRSIQLLLLWLNLELNEVVTFIKSQYPTRERSLARECTRTAPVSGYCKFVTFGVKKMHYLKGRHAFSCLLFGKKFFDS